MKLKKSQIQMGETIAVIFIFFILIFIGFIFYVRILKDDIAAEGGQLSQLRSVGIVQRIMFLPEIQCSEDNIIKDNCIDILKLESAKLIMEQNRLFYYDFFEFSNITISEIYPGNDQWTIYSRKAPSYSTRFVTNVPVSLYNASSKNYKFGLLSVTTEFR